MMNTEKQNEIPEPNQVDVEQGGDVLGVPAGRVYVSAWDQPVYLCDSDTGKSRFFVLAVEGIVRNAIGSLSGVVRVNVGGKITNFPVHFSQEDMVWKFYYTTKAPQEAVAGN